ASRVAAPNIARQGAGRRQWPRPAASFPCQVPQRRMAIFAAQPQGPGLFLRGAALFVVHLERPTFSPHALLRAKTGSGAVASETSTDPKLCSRHDPRQPCRLSFETTPSTGARSRVGDPFPAPAWRRSLVPTPSAQRQPLEPRAGVAGRLAAAPGRATIGAPDLARAEQPAAARYLLRTPLAIRAVPGAGCRIADRQPADSPSEPHARRAGSAVAGCSGRAPSGTGGEVLPRSRSRRLHPS